MPSGKITISFVKDLAASLVPGERQLDRIYRDPELMGFGLRVHPSGELSFVVQRKVGGRPMRRSVGKYPGMAVAQARDIAKDWLKLMINGDDPILEADKKAQANRAEWDARHRTFGIVYGEFEEARRNGSADETIRDRKKIPRTLANTSLWNSPFIKVDVASIQAAFGPLFIKKPGMGWKCLSYCQTAYEFEARQKGIVGNKFADWRAIYHPQPLGRRETELELDETWGRKWLRELINTRHSSDWVLKVSADYLLCVLLWGGRRTETARLRLDAVSLDGPKPWAAFIKENTKGKTAHYFPLTPWAVEILTERIKDDRSADGWAFPSRQYGKPLSGWGSGRLLDLLEEKSGSRVTAHDLRRTLASDLAAKSKYNLPLIALALNHAAAKSVTSGYVKRKTKIEALRPYYLDRERRIRRLGGLMNDKPAKLPSAILEALKDPAMKDAILARIEV